MANPYCTSSDIITFLHSRHNGILSVAVKNSENLYNIKKNMCIYPDWNVITTKQVYIIKIGKTTDG